MDIAYKIFSEAQVDEFIDLGFVKLEEAIPRQTALDAQDWLWGKLAERGVQKDDPTTWTEPLELLDATVRCDQEHPWLSELTGGTEGDPNTSRIDRFMNQTTVDEAGTPLRVIQTQASPGDVVFCHPFLHHSASPNHSGVPRFMCNRTTPLKAPMCLDRDDGDYSPVERSIRQGLGLTPRLVRN